MCWGERRAFFTHETGLLMPERRKDQELRGGLDHCAKPSRKTAGLRGLRAAGAPGDAPKSAARHTGARQALPQRAAGAPALAHFALHLFGLDFPFDMRAPRLPAISPAKGNSPRITCPPNHQKESPVFARKTGLSRMQIGPWPFCFPLLLDDLGDGAHGALLDALAAGHAGLFVHDRAGAADDLENLLGARIAANAATDALISIDNRVGHDELLLVLNRRAPLCAAVDPSSNLAQHNTLGLNCKAFRQISQPAAQCRDFSPTKPRQKAGMRPRQTQPREMSHIESRCSGRDSAQGTGFFFPADRPQGTALASARSAGVGPKGADDAGWDAYAGIHVGDRSSNKTAGARRAPNKTAGARFQRAPARPLRPAAWFLSLRSFVKSARSPLGAKIRGVAKAKRTAAYVSLWDRTKVGPQGASQHRLFRRCVSNGGIT